MMRSFIFLALLATFVAPALAINKCTGLDGKVSYQDGPCTGKGEMIEVRPSSTLILPVATPAKIPSVSEVPAPSALPSPAAQQSNPIKSPLMLEADRCLSWYKPKLRDPAGAYYSEFSKDGRVVTITAHATNGYGGYVTKQAACEFYNGRLDADWTKIHAKRHGWSVD